MKIVKLCLALACVVTLALATAAQNAPKPTAVAAVGAARIEASEPGRTLGKQETLTGSIGGVDPQTNTLTVTGSNGTPYEFKISHNSKITIDGRPGTLVDLTTHVNTTVAIEFVPTSTGNFVHSIELNTK